MKYFSIVVMGLVLASCERRSDWGQPVEGANTSKVVPPIRKLDVGVTPEKVCIEGVLYYYGVGYLEPVPNTNGGGIQLDRGTPCDD